MMAVLTLIILFFGLLTLAYYALPRSYWIALSAFLVIIPTWLETLYFPVIVALWIIYALVVLFIAVDPLRQRCLTNPLFRLFQRQLPPMSETELAAIEAGDTWWDKALFSGCPNWQDILSSPSPALTEAEEAFLQNEVATLCSLLDEWQITHEDKDLPQPVWQYIREKRFFGMRIAKEYGGLGFSELLHSSVIVKIASRSITAAVTVMVPNSLGPAELLVHYGTKAQKEYYLPRLARGEEIPCFGLTGVDAGSDAAAISDTGIVCYGDFQGKQTLGIKLNWEKRYITLAPVATLLGLAFKLSDPDKLLGAKIDCGITLCLIPSNHPGVEQGKRHLPMDLAFMNGPSRGKDVFVPLDWIIGGAPMAGLGWQMLMDCLSAGRSISLPAMSCASAQLCYRMSGAYAVLRKQFNMPIGHFEGIEPLLARIAGFTYLIEAVRQITAGAVDQGIKPAVVSAIIKYHTTEMSRLIVNDTMDLHAGRAIQMGPRNYLSFAYQAIPIGITVEGANILTRNLMIFGQGMIRCHPYLYDEIKAVHDPDRRYAFQTFDKLILHHIAHITKQFARSFFQGLLLSFKHFSPGVSRYYQQLSRMSAALAFTADIGILWVGGRLKRRERLSARYGDVLSYLYLSTAVLKYYQDHEQTDEDWIHVQWILQHNFYKTGEALLELFANFPNRFIGILLKWIVFPMGRRYKKPSDLLEQQLAQLLLSPSDLRNRLTSLCFIPDDSNDRLGRLEIAFNRHIACMPLIQKMRLALGKEKVSGNGMLKEDVLVQALQEHVITAEEVQQLREYDLLRKDALQVDEFDKL
ncbi:MAG: acyl-CoA dehydrogenase [Gammaproteobacteria bacterium]|jgi:alkylation response protein AidB-like acyl-CoA dehydrogenase|nr:acyl-CoA dehydrogenase [Gammaproteobacteria bacterium]